MVFGSWGDDSPKVRGIARRRCWILLITGCEIFTRISQSSVFPQALVGFFLQGLSDLAEFSRRQLPFSPADIY
jgi:hypothetical protein